MAAHESDVACHIDRLLVAQRDHTAFGPLEQLAPIGQRQFAPVGRIAEPSPLGIAIAAREQSSNRRSEAHTSELQSLMRISYAVFCLTKTTTTISYYNKNIKQ